MAIAARAAGAWMVTGTGGFNYTIPGSPQVSDRMFALASWKDQSVPLTTPDGWTLIENFADGTVASGNGTGSMRVASYYRDYQAGDSLVNFSWLGTPIVAAATIVIFSKDAGEAWNTPVSRTAAITNWGTTSQQVQASSNYALAAGQLVIGLAGIRDDSATFTRPTNGIQGSQGEVWTSDYVEYPATHVSTTTGNDMAADAGYRIVSTPGTPATTFLGQTATISAAETGAANWVVQGVSASSPPASLLIPRNRHYLRSLLVR